MSIASEHKKCGEQCPCGTYDDITWSDFFDSWLCRFCWYKALSVWKALNNP